MTHIISFDMGGFVFLIYLIMFFLALSDAELPEGVSDFASENVVGTVISVIVLAYTLSRVFGFALYNIFIKIWDPYGVRKLNKGTFVYLSELLEGSPLLEYLKQNHHKFLMFVQFCYHIGDEAISMGAEPLDEKVGREQYSANALQIMSEVAPIFALLTAVTLVTLLHFFTGYVEFVLDWWLAIPVVIGFLVFFTFRSIIKQSRDNSFELLKYYLCQKEKHIKRAVKNIEDSISKNPSLWE